MSVDGARVFEELTDSRVAAFQAKPKRGVTVARLHLRIGALAQQQLDRVALPGLNSDHQCGHAVVMTRVDVDAAIAQLCHQLNLSLMGLPDPILQQLPTDGGEAGWRRLR